MIFSPSEKIRSCKKAVAMVFIFVISAGILHAQSFGASAYLLGFSSKTPDAYAPAPTGQRKLGHMSSFSPGIRIETNYLLNGYTIPVSGFNGLGFSYFFPHSDSAFFTGRLTNGNSVNVPGKEVSKRYMISFRFGYEIPQTFNEFLMLHFGWGFGFQHAKTWFELPEKSATFNYDKSEFDPDTFEPTVDAGPFFEILAGGTYEFEKFYIVAHYSVMVKFGDSAHYMHSVEKYRHGLTAGIYYPIFRF